MMKTIRVSGVLFVIAFSALGAAQNQQQPSKPTPAPEMQRLAKMLVGTWKVDEDWAPGGTKPNGGKGTGHSVIRLGPGGFSLIEDFVDDTMQQHQHNVMWWDKKSKRFKAVGCDDLSGEGCSGVGDGTAGGQWEQNQVVWQFTFEQDGKMITAKMVWVEKDSRSFAATMYIDANRTLKRDWTFLHTRRVK